MSARREKAVDDLAILGRSKERSQQSISLLIGHLQTERDSIVREHLIAALSDLGRDAVPQITAVNILAQRSLAEDLGFYIGEKIRAQFPPSGLGYSKGDLDDRSNTFELVQLMELNWSTESRNQTSCGVASWGVISVIFRAREREYEQARMNAWFGATSAHPLTQYDVVDKVCLLEATNAVIVKMLKRMDGSVAGLRFEEVMLVAPDLHNLDLTGIDFARAALPYADFSKANLANVNLDVKP